MANSDFDETIPLSPDDNSSDQESAIKGSQDQTSPTLVNNEEGTQIDPPDARAESGKQRGPRWRLITLIGILSLILIAVLSAWSGYSSGINLRTEAQSTQISSEADSQFQLALQDMQDGQYFRARQRFEYVIELNSNYPGATDKLAEVLLMLNATATPSPIPTPTITPTPDTRQADEIEALFSQAEQQLANDDWAGSINTLLLVRKMDSGYRMIQVDGMLFLALRNQGLSKISAQADLEGGMYDLALAQRFGPLDTEAEGFLNWAKLYVTGASFWELDWGQAVFYFAQVAPQLPGLRDGSGWTANERYRLALIGFGNTLLLAGDPCQAMEQLQLSLSLGYDPAAEQALNEAIKGCQGGKNQEQPPADQPSEPPPTGLPDPGQEPDPYPNP